MNFFAEIFSNYPLICAIVGWLTAQLAKTLVNVIRLRRLCFVSLISSGGMPSSHSAAVCAMATGVGMECGFQSALFAVAAVFAYIVMYDASGVRRAAGEQAKILNRMMEELDEGRTQDLPAHLKELIGHTPLQVFVGAAVGIAVALLLFLI